MKVFEVDIVKLLFYIGATRSLSEGRRLIEQGAIRKIIPEFNTEYKILDRYQWTGKEFILEVGNRRFYKIVW